MRLTLDEYSKQYKMSKEMIKSKLKIKKLNYIIEDGITYIIAKAQINNINPVHKPIQKVQTETIVMKPITKQKTTVGAVLSLYQRENQQLKDKILELEAKVDKLIDDKEQMLRDERDKIEEVYSTKDAQLKNILELINTKLTLENSVPLIHEVEPCEPKDKVINKPKKKIEEIIEFKIYLKSLDIKDYKKKIIKKRFLSAYDNDIRILQKNGKLYLDFSKYDYSDLLAF